MMEVKIGTASRQLWNGARRWQSDQALQLLVEPWRRNGDRRAEFLREQGDFEFFNHPAEFRQLPTRLRQFWRVRFEFSQRRKIRGELLGALLIFHRIQLRPFHARGERLQVTRQMRHLDSHGHCFEKSDGLSAALFSRLIFTNRWSNQIQERVVQLSF